MGLKTLLSKLGLIESNKKDYSHLSEEVLELVRALKEPVFPMFGTLLSLHRDKAFLFADDYDFAFFDRSLMSLKFIEKVESLGASLKGASVVNDELIELSFTYKKVGIDFFYLSNEAGQSVHLCPNFRTGNKVKSKKGSIKLRNFDSYFSVSYPEIELHHDESLGLMMPTDPVSIFEQHYGNDWNIKKTRNFIDFNNYTFTQKDAQCYAGSSEKLKAMLIDKGLLV